MSQSTTGIQTIIVSAFAFTEAQKVDIRRFMGYGAFGAGESGFESWRFFKQYGVLEFRLNNLQLEEATIALAHVANCLLLDADMVGLRSSLNIGSAAVYVRNKQEMRERQRLYDRECKRLCDDAGIEYGPNLQSGSLEAFA